MFIRVLRPVYKNSSPSWENDRELKQPRRRWQQNPHKFAYLTMKNSIFARFARALFIFWHFEDVLVLSTTWNYLFCSCVDDVSILWQMFNFLFLCPKCWFQFNSRIARTHFSSTMTLNNWKMLAETRSYIFRWRSCFRWRGVFLSSLIMLCMQERVFRAPVNDLYYKKVGLGLEAIGSWNSILLCGTWCPSVNYYAEDREIFNSWIPMRKAVKTLER